MTPIDFQTIVDNHRFVLMEAAVIETLRHEFRAALHPQLANAPLIYNPAGRHLLTQVYRQFFKVAAHYRQPLLICSPTWRASRDRVIQAGVSENINGDAVNFLKALQKESQTTVLVGGLVGCKNDCYQAQQGLMVAKAADYHAWQIGQLAAKAPDFLMAATLPAVPEAIGLALAMGATGLPYLLSFVIGADSHLLDGTTLNEAIQQIDQRIQANPPYGYLVNCSYPSYLTESSMTPMVRKRLIGFQANASSKPHDELNHSDTLQLDDQEDWLDHMLHLHQRWGIKILGGCCGTNAAYLEKLAKRIQGGLTRGV